MANLFTDPYYSKHTGKKIDDTIDNASDNLDGLKAKSNYIPKSMAFTALDESVALDINGQDDETFLSEEIPAVTTTKAGVMTPAQLAEVAQLQSNVGDLESDLTELELKVDNIGIELDGIVHINKKYSAIDLHDMNKKEQLAVDIDIDKVTQLSIRVTDDSCVGVTSLYVYWSDGTTFTYLSGQQKSEFGSVLKVNVPSNTKKITFWADGSNVSGNMSISIEYSVNDNPINKQIEKCSNDILLKSDKTDVDKINNFINSNNTWYDIIKTTSGTIVAKDIVLTRTIHKGEIVQIYIDYPTNTKCSFTLMTDDSTYADRALYSNEFLTYKAEVDVNKIRVTVRGSNIIDGAATAYIHHVKDEYTYQINYGNSLFTSNWNATGTTRDSAHRTCFKRKIEPNVVGILFAVGAYDSHTYLQVFDSNGNAMASEQMSGSTSTQKFKKYMFKDGASYYSVQTLSFYLEDSYLYELVDDVNAYIIKKEASDINSLINTESSDIEEINDTISVLKDKTYSAIKNIELEEWSNLQFGMFIHWGVYSAWHGLYNGVDIDGNDVSGSDYSEWMWHSGRIPKDVYVAKASEFNSAGWNPDYICKLAKSVGMKYIVLTVRHHEGFSLYPSQNTEWDITSSSASTDVVMQLKDACTRHGLKFSIYVSILMDWYDQGGYDQATWNHGVDPYSEEQHSAFVDRMIKYMNELVEVFEPYTIWYDGGTYISASQSVKDKFNANQLKNYPYTIVNERGEGVYDYNLAENSYADYPNTSKKYERCNSVAGWGYNSVTQENPETFAHPENILWDMMENMGRGFNYLLNISPKGDGSIPVNYDGYFAKLSSFFRKYTYFNGAKRLFNYAQPSWGRPICVGNSVYCFLLPNISSSINVDSILTDNIKGVHIYGIENADAESNYNIVSNDRLTISNIPTLSTDYFPVVRIDYYGEPICLDYNIVTDSISALSLVRLEHREWSSVPSGVKKNGTFMFGNSKTIAVSNFKFNGNSGDYNVIINGEQPSGSITYTIKVYKNGSLIGSSSVDSSFKSSNKFSFLNSEIYRVEIIKEGESTMSVNSIVIA